MVILDRLVEADWDTILLGSATRPTLDAYWRRLEARQSYRTEVLEMRCPITRKGMAEARQAKAEDAKLKRALEG